MSDRFSEQLQRVEIGEQEDSETEQKKVEEKRKKKRD